MLLVLSIFTGATYAASSLWGEIDEPQATPVVAPPTATTELTSTPALTTTPASTTTPKTSEAKIKKVGVKAATATTTPVVVAEPVALPEKSICEILKNQISLDPNIMRSPAIQNAMRNFAQNAPARYKGILTSTTGINAAFVLYRSEYLKKYCS